LKTPKTFHFQKRYFRYFPNQTKTLQPPRLTTPFFRAISKEEIRARDRKKRRVLTGQCRANIIIIIIGRKHFVVESKREIWNTD
jgi:hypothetical protein